MPIVKISGPDALRLRKTNKAATWGNRQIDNRVEPIAAPAFETPFQLQPGESIFTIGSCFARNVETELIRQGFELPMRKLFSTSVFANLEKRIVDNFGTPSIYNEIAWAFDELPFDEEMAFLHVGRDKFVDLHLIPMLRPAPIETLRARRKGLFTATRSLADCRVIIMTLGLVEIWWDEEAKLYLNREPPRVVMRKLPDRFSLHVLGVADCVDYLEQALEIIFRHGRADVRIILTVSPVPMTATHRSIDVMSANSYSKSVLRVAAEYVVEQHEQIVYFPSYETVTISDRQLAWMDDLVHVQKEMVAFNVERMVNAFSGEKNRAEIHLPMKPQVPKESVAERFFAEKARQARMNGNATFFEEHARKSASSPGFTIEYARFLFDRKAYNQAYSILKTETDPGAQLLCAECCLEMKSYDKAAAIAEKICHSSQKGMQQWRIFLQALWLKGASQEELERVEAKWLKVRKGAAHIVHLHIGIAMRNSGFLEAALERLKSAREDSRSTNSAELEYAQCHMQIGNHREVAEILDGFEPESRQQRKTAQKILEQSKVLAGSG